MRFRAIVMLVLTASAFAQSVPKAVPPELKSVTVPIGIDHNHIVVNVDLTLPDGSSKRVHGWVDNGNADLYLSRHVATLLGLPVTCDDKACSAPPPAEIVVGGMKLSLTGIGIKEAKIPLKPVDAASVMADGVPVEINLPSPLLRHYDVLVNFPNREFTIAQPGTLKFRGSSARVLVNAENGLIQIPSQIEGKYNLALDLGASISLLSEGVFDKLAAAHGDWPHMTGAVGPANMWGFESEPKWKLMRLGRVQFGPLFLTDVAVVEFPKDWMAWFEKRSGIPTAGLIGSEALLNYRVGLDYAHSAVYFEIGSTFRFPDFDVIGLILRAEDDGRFTILGVADYDGKPSVEGVTANDHLVAVDGIPVRGSSMGQVWLMLGGTPGKERTLTVERDGKEFKVVARVQHFLGEATPAEEKKEVSRKKNR